MQLRRSCPIDWALLPPLSLSHWGDRERLSPLSLGPAPPQSECNCGGAAPLIGLYSHRCPTRTGATERGSRPSPSAGRLPSARATAAESCTFVVLYSHRRRSRTGPTPMYLEDVGATPHLDHRSHKSIRSATPVEPSISRPPSPAPKSRTGHPGGRLGRKSYLSPTESGKSGSTVRFRPADEFGFFRVPLPYIDNWSVAFHNQKKKKATAMGLRKFGNFPRGFLPAPPPITPVLLAI